MFVVPIQPKYLGRLFPDVDPQCGLSPGETAYGNSILKAYLCHAPLRQLKPGHVLLFYRSQSRQARAVGVVEETLVSESAEAASHLVGRRTVYDYATIRRVLRARQGTRDSVPASRLAAGVDYLPTACRTQRAEGSAANDHQSVTTKGRGVADQSNRAVALMSIKPEFAARIISGEKRVEFRKQAFREDVSPVVIYSTTPVAAIVGVCEVDGVFVATPSTVWRKYAASQGSHALGSRPTTRTDDVPSQSAWRSRCASRRQLSSIGERRPPQVFAICQPSA